MILKEIKTIETEKFVRIFTHSGIFGETKIFSLTHEHAIESFFAKTQTLALDEQKIEFKLYEYEILDKSNTDVLTFIFLDGSELIFTLGLNNVYSNHIFPKL